MVMPLESIKIIQMECFGPANFAAWMLGDLGADILLVELPSPRPYPARDPDVTDEIRFPGHALENRNKRSIALNLKNEAAREIFYRLVKDVDVLIEANRPGVLKRLGAGYDKVSQLNPGIVYASTTGYGQTGPYSHLPGHDGVWQAIAGSLSLGRRLSWHNMGTQREDTGPPTSPLPLADLKAGYHTAIGILSALAARQATGKGQHVDIAIMDGAVSLPWEGAGQRPPNLGNQVLTCKDGKYIVLAAIENWTWANLCKAIDREDFIPHQHAVGAKRDEINDALRQIFLTRTRDEWFAFLKPCDTEAGPVNELHEVASDPQVQHRQMIQEVTLPSGRKGPQLGIPIKFSDTPARLRDPAPRRGQHTIDILQGLGYGEDKIAELKASGAIGADEG